MNSYEAKQERRRERLENAADRAEARAEAASNKARDTSRVIPLGQPILVGHHSEGRHRRDLERIRKGHERAAEESRRAEQLRRRAKGVGKAGVSSDDPDAAEKLREKLTALEAQRYSVKAINADARKVGAAAAAAKVTPHWKQEILQSIRFGGGTDTRPFPGYVTSNLGARIRDTKKRIEHLERLAAERDAAGDEHEVLGEGDGWRIEVRLDLNRVAFVSDGKPSAEVRALLKGSGFRWSRDEEAWLAYLTARYRYVPGIVNKLTQGQVSL